MKRAFDVKQKAFFIIFKGLSAAKNCLRPESAPLIKRHILWHNGNYFPMLSMLTKITWCKNIPQRKPLTSIFFKPQFSYCPLAAMCSSCSVNQEINRLIERYLGKGCNYKTSSFKELLSTKGYLVIYTVSLLVPAAEGSS